MVLGFPGFMIGLLGELCVFWGILALKLRYWVLDVSGCFSFVIGFLGLGGLGFMPIGWGGVFVSGVGLFCSFGLRVCLCFDLG